MQSSSNLGHDPIRDLLSRTGRVSIVDRCFLLLLAVSAGMYMLWLSGHLLVVPGGITATRINVLFNADTSVWLDRIDRVGKPLWMELSISHPLRPFLWGVPARGMAYVLGQFMDPGAAAILAAKLLTAGLFGSSVGCLALLGHRLGLSRFRISMLFLIACTCSANAVIASTDHFGISFSLMVCSVCAIFLVEQARLRLIVQLLLGLAIFGTTVTNALVPLLNVVFILRVTHGWDIGKYIGKKLGIAFAGVFFAALSGLAWWHENYRGSSLILSVLNFRLVSDPVAFLQYALAGIAYPVMAPVATLGQHGITLEPIHVRGWPGVYGIAVALWIYVVAEAVIREARLRVVSPVFWISLPCLIFNIVFHNIWGDEYFLFSPHWSWVFLIVLLFRFRLHSPWWPGLAFLVILPMQVLFFAELHSLLDSLKP